MGRSNKNSGFFLVIFFSSALCTIYSLFFHPITYEAQGDFPAYLDLAKQIYDLPGASDTDLSHRSPLYSLILGLFIIIFGEAHFLAPLVVFQYILIFLTSLLVYKVIFQLTDNKTAAFIAGIAGILNLTTVFYGYMILSETLALFLFTLTAWLLLKFFQEERLIYSAAAGIFAGLLVLTRYNTLGLPLVVTVLFLLLPLLPGKKLRLPRVFSGAALFVTGVLLILNLWALRNYISSGKYEVLPKHHTGQRWAVPSTISPDDIVSSEYREVLDIFLKTRDDLVTGEVNRRNRKSSLLEYGLIEKVNNYFRPDISGYLIYRDSEEELLNYFHLESNPEGIRALNEKLKPFYDEIAIQNKNEIRRLRVYSLLYSFKHISPTIPGESKLNLNNLPSFLLQTYKVLFILIMVLTYAGSAVHVFYLLSRKERPAAGKMWFIIYGIIWYFPVVNTYAIVLGDANRFRFPADMLIIGIFVAFCFHLFRYRYKSGGIA